MNTQFGIKCVACIQASYMSGVLSKLLETVQKADGMTDAINTSIVIEPSHCYL